MSHTIDYCVASASNCALHTATRLVESLEDLDAIYAPNEAVVAEWPR